MTRIHPAGTAGRPTCGVIKNAEVNAEACDFTVDRGCSKRGSLQDFLCQLGTNPIARALGTARAAGPTRLIVG
jgi:hypothetical protein